MITRKEKKEMGGGKQDTLRLSPEAPCPPPPASVPSAIVTLVQYMVTLAQCGLHQVTILVIM